MRAAIAEPSFITLPTSAGGEVSLPPFYGQEVPGTGIELSQSFHIWAVKREVYALSRTPRHRPGLQPICDSKRYTPFPLLRAARRPIRYLAAHLSAQDPESQESKMHLRVAKSVLSHDGGVRLNSDFGGIMNNLQFLVFYPKESSCRCGHGSSWDRARGQSWGTSRRRHKNH